MVVGRGDGDGMGWVENDVIAVHRWTEEFVKSRQCDMKTRQDRGGPHLEVMDQTPPHLPMVLLLMTASNPKQP